MTEERDLSVSRIIAAPRSAIWTAWKDPSHLVRWWAPKPVETVVRKHEFYPGGAFDTVMKLPDGTEHAGEGCFLEVIEHERIVFTDALRGGWRPNEESLFTAVITMANHPNGILYTATALHKNDKDRQTHAEMGFEKGWAICLDQLAEVAQSIA